LINNNSNSCDVMSKEKKLPDKINESFPIMSQTAMEIHELIRKYNALPIGDPRRKPIYEKIEDRVQFEKYWD